LLMCAGRGRIAPHPRRIRQFSTFALCRRLLRLAALCCIEWARKGQRSAHGSPRSRTAHVLTWLSTVVTSASRASRRRPRPRGAQTDHLGACSLIAHLRIGWVGDMQLRTVRGC
jgi:hypothetical protein